MVNVVKRIIYYKSMESYGIEYKFIIFVILLFILYFFVRMIYNSYRLRKEYFTTKEQMNQSSIENHNVCKGGEDYYKKAMNPHICSSGEGLDRTYHYYQNCKYVDKDDNCVCCFPATD